MRRIQLAGLAALTGLLVPLTSCSSGGGGAGSGTMFIETCTLGCSNGQGGLQVSCTIVDVAQNVEITVLFSQPVQLSSVNAGSFQITNTLNGSSPVGTFVLDPLNTRRLIFRPALTFDEVGNPIFALDPDQTYEIVVPGAVQGDGSPIVQSIGGKINQTRMRCTIATTQGRLDPVPGPPSQETAILVLDDTTGEIVESFNPASGSTNVPVGGGADGKVTQILTVFDDIMNPATLANLSTGQSSTITVEIDVDGDPVTTDDRVVQEGFFEVEVSFEELRTRLLFTPTGGFPSGGVPGATRLMVMTLPSTCLDLVGNPLDNPGEIVFQTQEIFFPEVILPVADPNVPDDMPGEQFQNQNNLDGLRSGADWGNGRLTYGVGGGTGRLGELVVLNNAVVQLDTDSQEFPIPGIQIYDLMDNVPITDYTPGDRATWPTLTIENGAFEFTSFVIEGGGTVEVVGSNPGRLYARGLMDIGGVINGSGISALDHKGNSGREADNGQETALGGEGGVGGPSAGPGGAGADRFNQGENEEVGCNVGGMLTAGGILFVPSPPNNPGTDNDGRVGGGVGDGAIAGGTGGIHWPENPPRILVITNVACFGDTEFTTVPSAASATGFECRMSQVAGAGSGGGYALNGGEGVAISPQEGLPQWPGVNSLAPPDTTGGDSGPLGIEAPGAPPMIRKLEYSEGNLRGGSGGGGGGMSIYASKTNTNPVDQTVNCFGDAGNLNPYWDHSAAGGGGGGGALQLTAGMRLNVGFSGFVALGGGDGGGSIESLTTTIDGCTSSQADANCDGFAAPGGGGSGGAVRLQSLVVELSANLGKVNVSGGQGGLSSTGSIGGAGSPGLVRIEKQNPLDEATEAAIYAPSIAPYMPNDPEFNNPFPSAAILSIGEWEFQRTRPDSLSASMSCWMIPEGNFFELEFLGTDDDMTTNPADKGWNVEIQYFVDGVGLTTFPYRGIPTGDPNFPLGGMDFQEFLGNYINSDMPEGDGSLIAVRFQGARTAGSITDNCDVQLGGIGADIQTNSLTRWVTHPAQLNEFLPRPNMVRFCLILEENLRSQGPMEFRITGLTNLRIDAQPN